MREADWDRYWYYAGRVRDFFYPSETGEDEKIVNHTKVRLAQLWKLPLLPALRRFVCPDVQAPGLFIHTLFLTHTLETVELRFVSDPEDVAIGSVLAAMVDETPLLKNLVICGTLSKQSISFVSQFNNLQSLELRQMGSAIDSQFFHQLGTLKSLTTLTVDLFDSLSTDFPIHVDGFPALTTFCIIASFPIMNTVINNLSAHKTDLSSLTFIGPPGPSTQGWEAQLTNLLNKTRQHWAASLRSLTIDQESDWEQTTLAMTDIAPVFRLPKLTSFSIDRYTMVFSNDHICQFAAAWPSLEALQLPLDMRIVSAGAEPSLPALFKLTEMCPRLKRVQIPLHVKDFSAATVVDGPPLTHVSALEELIVGSPTGLYTNMELLALARCLDRRFPRVRSVKHLRDATDMWEKVYLMILALRSARAEMETLLL